MSRNSKLEQVIHQARTQLFGDQGSSADPPPEPVAQFLPVPVHQPDSAVFICHSRGPHIYNFPEPDALTRDLRLTRGARKLFTVLHSLACRVVQDLNRHPQTTTLTLHLPQVLLAAALSCTPRHLYRLKNELIIAGLIDAGPHAAKVKCYSAWDGSLWAIKLHDVPILPRILREEWTYRWRSMEQDIARQHTARSILERMSALDTQTRKKALEDTIYKWAVELTPASLPVPNTDIFDRPCHSAKSMREHTLRLEELSSMHPSKRDRAIEKLAEGISQTLNDAHSARWYARVISQAWQGMIQGQADLTVLSNELLRIDEERREWEGLRNPGALLASRLNKKERPAA